MKPAVMPRDTEKFVVDFFTEDNGDAIAELGECTVGVNVPSGWTPAWVPHLQVTSDGDPVGIWPIATRDTIRLTARAGTTSDAKELCGLALGLLLAHNGDADISSTRYLTGVLPARDPQTHVELASATARVTVRTEPIPVGS